MDINKTTDADGLVTTNVTITADKLHVAFAQLKDIVVTGPAKFLTIKLPIFEGAGKVTLPATVLNDVYVDQPNVVISIQSSQGGYSLPLKALDYNEIAKSLGAALVDIKISVSLIPATADLKKQMSQSAFASGLSLKGTPIEYKITAEANGKTIEINNFGSTYVERTIELTEPIDADHSSGVLYDSTTRTFTFVPTFFEKNAMVPRKLF